MEILVAKLPNTLLLGGTTLAVLFPLGILLGTIQGVRRGSTVDTGISVASLFLYSMPSFWLAMVLQLLLAYHLGLFPIDGMHATMADTYGVSRYAWDTVKHLLLPGVAMGIAFSAGVARYMRSSLLEVIEKDYVRTARAKGLPERTVIGRHALRNALLPIVTLVGLSVPALFTGSVLVETIFSWPGMGREIYLAIDRQDTPVIIGCFFVITLVVASATSSPTCSTPGSTRGSAMTDRASWLGLVCPGVGHMAGWAAGVRDPEARRPATSLWGRRCSATSGCSCGGGRSPCVRATAGHCTGWTSCSRIPPGCRNCSTRCWAGYAASAECGPTHRAHERIDARRPTDVERGQRFETVVDPAPVLALVARLRHAALPIVPDPRCSDGPNTRRCPLECRQRADPFRRETGRGEYRKKKRRSDDLLPLSGDSGSKAERASTRPLRPPGGSRTQHGSPTRRPEARDHRSVRVSVDAAESASRCLNSIAGLATRRAAAGDDSWRIRRFPATSKSHRPRR